MIYGNGIGFHCHKGDILPADSGTKKFFILDDDYKNKLISVLDEIPFDCIELTQRIIEATEKKIKKKLNFTLLFNMADHINFTVRRYREAIEVPSLINEEIKRFYRDEYELGREALSMINTHYHICLNDTEAAALAFHIINATEAIENAETRKILYGVRDIVSITEKTLHTSIDQESLDYSRFVIHLKYFLKSVLTHSKVTGTNNNFLFTLLSQTNTGVKECLNEIDDYTRKIFSYQLTRDDRTYLTIHLMRLFREK